MVKFRKIAFLTMAAVLLSTCATGISNLSESRVGGQYTVYAAETQADAGESVATLTDATATVKNKKGWYTKNGKTYYYDENGKALKSKFLTYKGGKYYFNRYGRMVRGINKIQNNYYYFRTNGKALVNTWKKIKGKKYYFGSDGKAYKGAHKVKNSKYYYNFSSNGYLAEGVRKINGVIYRFGSNGKPYTGWYTTKLGNRQYYSASGVAYKGPKKVNGKLYLFDKNGALVKGRGWKYYNGKRYFVSVKGTLLTGYRYVDGAYYYFSKSGAMYRSKWAYANGYKFYFNRGGKRLTDVDKILGKQDSYEIKVNKTTNVATVYAKDGNKGYIIPVKAFVCSGGDTTPLGTFYTPAKGRWWTLMGPCYGQWDTLITGDILFHSVYYGEEDPTTLSVSAYNMLGTTCSHGCIRLKAGDAKWIYDNCDLGTKVTIFESNKSGPFPKPTSVQLDYSHTWDPTDPTMAYKCRENGCHKGIAW